MKIGVIEEINKIRGLMFYGHKIITEQLEVIKVDEPKKADLVVPNVDEFYKTLESVANSGGLTQQDSKTITYQKAVESLQIALQLLGYKLPKYGVDGLFGPETAEAVKQFLADNPKKQVSEQITINPNAPVTIDKTGIEQIIAKLKNKGINPMDIKPYIDTLTSKFADSTKYKDIINKYSQQYGVNPLLVSSVIHVESKWNENAKSDAGAYGLMQLMPKTAKGLDVDLYNPVENIKGGIKYLAQMLKQFNNNVEHALKAYNWGSGNMTSYLRTGRGVNGQEMPQETAQYPTKILNVYNTLKINTQI